MTNIGIIGSRSRNSDLDYKLFSDFMDEYLKIYQPGSFQFVSGGCSKGGDRFAEIYAQDHNIPIKIFYPDKSKMKSNSRSEYAKICYERNILIAKNSNELIAIVSNERKGGTEHTIKNFIKFKNKNPLIL